MCPVGKLFYFFSARTYPIEATGGPVAFFYASNIFSVCGDNFGDDEADVICRTAGFEGGAADSTYFREFFFKYLFFLFRKPHFVIIII